MGVITQFSGTIEPKFGKKMPHTVMKKYFGMIVLKYGCLIKALCLKNTWLLTISTEISGI